MWGIGILLVLGTIIQFIISDISVLNVVLMIISVLFLISTLPFVAKLLVKLGFKGYFKIIIPIALILIYLVAGAIFFPFKEEKEVSSSYNKAMKLLSQKEYEKVDKIFSEIEAKYPQDDQILLGKALLYMNMKNYDQAWNYLSRAYQVNPYNININYNMALSSYHRGNKQDALKRFEDIISINSRFLRPRLYAGTINMELGDYPAAIYQLNEAKIISPDSLEVHYNLGKAHYSIMEYGEAKISFEKALTLNPPKEIEDSIKNVLAKISTYLGGDKGV